MGFSRPQILSVADAAAVPALVALAPASTVPVTTATFAIGIAHAGKVLFVTRTATGACAMTIDAAATAD